jgi:hypothetical protein
MYTVKFNKAGAPIRYGRPDVETMGPFDTLRTAKDVAVLLRRVGNVETVVIIRSMDTTEEIDQ